MPKKYLDRKYSKLLPRKGSVSQCFKAFRSIGCLQDKCANFLRQTLDSKRGGLSYPLSTACHIHHRPPCSSSWVSPPMPSLVLLHRHSRREIKDEMPRPARKNHVTCWEVAKNLTPPKFNIAPEKSFACIMHQLRILLFPPQFILSKSQPATKLGETNAFKPKSPKQLPNPNIDPLVSTQTSPFCYKNYFPFKP